MNALHYLNGSHMNVLHHLNIRDRGHDVHGMNKLDYRFSIIDHLGIL